jgi:hypothetical protein
MFHDFLVAEQMTSRRLASDSNNIYSWRLDGCAVIWVNVPISEQAERILVYGIRN